MSNPDEQAIRDLIATWMRMSAEGDGEALRSLMAEEVVFLVPGNPPMRGREAFLQAFQGVSKFYIEGKSEVQEIQVAGDWAYCWTHLHVTMTAKDGGPARARSGYTLTILRREPDGHWVIARDANLLTADAPADTPKTR